MVVNAGAGRPGRRLCGPKPVNVRRANKLLTAAPSVPPVLESVSRPRCGCIVQRTTDNGHTDKQKDHPIFALPAVQAALRSFNLDGWLLYDFRGLNVLARRVVALPA